MSRCNWLDSETLGSHPIIPKNLPDIVMNPMLSRLLDCHTDEFLWRWESIGSVEMSTWLEVITTTIWPKLWKKLATIYRIVPFLLGFLVFVRRVESGFSGVTDEKHDQRGPSVSNNHLDYHNIKNSANACMTFLTYWGFQLLVHVVFPIELCSLLRKSKLNDLTPSLNNCARSVLNAPHNSRHWGNKIFWKRCRKLQLSSLHFRLDCWIGRVGLSGGDCESGVVGFRV